MDQLLGHLSQDSSVTYSEKVITLTPSASSSSTPAANGAGTKASPTGPRKSVKGGFVPEGAYPLDGERTVEKAREHYERCTRESLVKIHQAKFPTESVSRHVKPDLIADILQRITLPMWSKSELVAEATKYDVKIGARTTKDQLALGIVAHLRARGLINAKARGVSASSSSSSSSTASPGPALAPAPAPMATQPSAPALTTLTGPTPTAQPLFTTPLELAPASTTSSSSSPSLSSSPLASSARSLVKEERSAKRKEKDSSQEKEKEKRARKKTKNTEPPAIATEELLGAGRTSSQPSFSIDVVSLVDQVKRYGSAPPVATDPANLEPERVMRLQTLHLIDLLLNVGATSPNDMAFLAGQLKPHVQREKAALASGPQWVDAHKRTLEKRQLKRKRDKAQRKLEQAQAAMAECNQQLASLRDA